MKLPLESTDIQAILPHRYPFLLIDRIVEMTPKQRIVALKNVTANEQFFQGHFPGYPLMPGVLMIEAMAQTGAVLLLSDIGPGNKLAVFAGIEKAKFRRQVVPGDQLRIEVEVAAYRHGCGRMEGTVLVDGKRVCEATLSCQIVPRAPQS
jgi:3-hydroxyacyl-[acyl-carrier-protein] dehydratase